MRTPISSHQYVPNCIFPVQINTASVVAILCGHQALSDKEDLIEAFLEYISVNESLALKAALTHSEQINLINPVILSDYQVKKRPLHRYSLFRSLCRDRSSTPSG